MHHIVNGLQNKARKHPNHQAIIYLEDGEQESARITYGELDRRAKIVASHLCAQNMTGLRVMLLYPTGIDFIITLMGCWYAGVIAVPVSCPKVAELEKNKAFLNSIAADADIIAVISLDCYCHELRSIIADDIKIIASDCWEVINPIPTPTFNITDETIAYLQYTSGSTSAPKAAIITQGNLTHSLKETARAWHYTKASITLNWAPHTHVYGLICGLLVPIYHGSLAIIMPPAAFINKPLVWLSAITKYGVSHSGCPNFGYDICVQNIKESELAALNLEPWKVAINGGDNVHHNTLVAFAHKFGSCGFELKRFCSAYGMSEVTGAIAVTLFEESPLCDPLYSSENQQRRLVSSGRLLKGLEAVAVDPETFLPVSDGQTGEIWLSGKSVVSGYWRRPDENQVIFNARIPDSPHSYFRTGDLGFIFENELYLTGRLKEVMVVYGKKYYPLDFEITIANALNTFKNCFARVAFSIEIKGKEE
ncbi:MAG: AMP-binding protein, partial [bacterium]|nr:AMP-binding protein [bacterium]